MAQSFEPRVVSLLASATEVICALSADDLLVARSHECDFPPSITTLPAVSRPLIDIQASSAEIDAQVRSRSRNALSIYDIDLKLLEQVRPDIIVTQTQCEVCAVSLKDVEEALQGDIGVSPKIVSLNPNTLEDIWSDIALIATALRKEREGERLIEELKARLKKISDNTKNITPRRALTVEWIEPLMTAGNWMPEIIAIAGGATVDGACGRHSEFVDPKKIAALAPEVIVIFPCGFDLDRTCREAEQLRLLPGWDLLPAVRSNEVYAIDGNTYCNRPGPRIVESTEILAEVFHPQLFSFGHEGCAWRKFS